MQTKYACILKESMHLTPCFTHQVVFSFELVSLFGNYHFIELTFLSRLTRLLRLISLAHCYTLSITRTVRANFTWNGDLDLAFYLLCST